LLRLTSWGLPYDKNNMTICQAVFIWYRNVTDGRTDRQTDRQTDLLYQYRASAYWRAIMKHDVSPINFHPERRVRASTEQYVKFSSHRILRRLTDTRTTKCNVLVYTVIAWCWSKEVELKNKIFCNFHTKITYKCWHYRRPDLRATKRG